MYKSVPYAKYRYGSQGSLTLICLVLLWPIGESATGLGTASRSLSLIVITVVHDARHSPTFFALLPSFLLLSILLFNV